MNQAKHSHVEKFDVEPKLFHSSANELVQRLFNTYDQDKQANPPDEASTSLIDDSNMLTSRGSTRMKERSFEPRIASDASGKQGRAAALAAGAAMVLVSVLATIFFMEAGFRIVSGQSVTEFRNWRLDNVRTKRIGDRAIPDPQLGWTLRADHRTPRFNTIDHGVRRNFDEDGIRQGGVLAVGDSFTEGFDEVVDAETWPSHLETKLGVPVVNAGVAGYASDQIILRAEQLIPIVTPRTLIVGLTEVDISRAALSEAGAPKPYFTVENDELIYHPPGPLDAKTDEGAVRSALRKALGYSLLADHLLSRLAPKFWYPAEASVYREVINNPVDITCRLLKRLKRMTDTRKIQLLLFLQYGGELVLEEPEIVYDMRDVTLCARESEIEVVDQFAPLKALTNSNPVAVAEYYVLHNGEFGHMSSKGNDHAASLLAEAIKRLQLPANATLRNDNTLQN